jgi:hypothetical protein
MGGIFRDTAQKDKVADFSYESDALAQLIVDMWAGQHKDLVKTASTHAQYKARSDAAKKVLEARGFYFNEPIVITEDEFDKIFTLEGAGLSKKDGVVLVLPRPGRAKGAKTAGGSPLLETAKMLMAITPHGI